jgi:hypothetical protein
LLVPIIIIIIIIVLVLSRLLVFSPLLYYTILYSTFLFFAVIFFSLVLLCPLIYFLMSCLSSSNSIQLYFLSSWFLCVLVLYIDFMNQQENAIDWCSPNVNVSFVRPDTIVTNWCHMKTFNLIEEINIDSPWTSYNQILGVSNVLFVSGLTTWRRL